MEARKDIANQLKEQGKTYRQIGKVLGITRQRVHQILTGYESPTMRRRRLERLKNKGS